MPTLHSNNPVPSNGSVATVIRGVKSISMALSGVGTVRAVVQIMAKEDGAAPGPIGNQIVVSGTTTVTTTQTFNADAGQVYLQLIDITPNCKFSATLTDLGPIQDTNPGSPSAPFTTVDERTAWATANLTSLLSGRTTAWGPGASTEYVWNGPLATDWQGIRGPYLGSAENPFPDAAALPASGAYIGDTKYLVSPNVPCGMVRREWCNGVWQTPAGGTILQKSNPLSLLNPGNTDAAILPIATIPINSVVDGDWEMILGYEQGAANTGTDNLGLDVNGVNMFSTGNVVAGAVPQLWSHLLRFVRMGTAIRIFYYQRLGGFVSAISGITIDFSVAVNLSWRAQPGNGANNLYLRNVSLRRVN